MNNYTKNLVIFFIFLFIFAVGVSNFSPVAGNLFNKNIANAASPNSNGFGNVFSYYPAGQIANTPSGSEQTLQICERAVQTMNCPINVGQGNGKQDPYIIFTAQGDAGGGKYVFTGFYYPANLGSDKNITLTVLDSNPSSGVWQLQGDSNTYNVTISNYTSASAGIPPGSPGLVGGGCVVTGGPSDIKVSSLLSGGPNDNNLPVTVTYNLNNGGNLVTSIASSPATMKTIGGIAGTDTSANITATFTQVPAGCYTVTSADLNGSAGVTVINGSANPSPVVLDGSITPTGEASSTAANPGDPCDGSPFSMSWAVCPFAHAMASGVSLAEGFIGDELNIPVNSYFDNTCAPANSPDCKTSSTNYKIWSNMRNLSLSLLVIAALIMVIATALDFGPFDAYTVKKTMPKIVIAIIAITFSWQICRLLVQFSDDLGAGVSQLIYSAAGLSPQQVLSGIGAGVFAWLGIGAAGAAGAIILGLGTVGPLALLMLLLPLIIGVLLAFLALVLRRLIIVVCVIFSPLAFVAYVFPGGQKIWKIWKDSFFGALFVYPMITGLIAIGGILAYLMDSSPPTASDPIKPLISLILFVAPFFLIPKLFKMSTGALGMLSGAMSNAKQGWNKSLSKQRKEKWATQREKSKVGGLYSGRNMVSRRLGAIGVGAGSGGGIKGAWGMNAKGKEATSNTKLAAATDKMRDPKFRTATDNKDTRNALMHGSEAKARSAGVSEAGITAAKAVGFNSQNQLGALVAEQVHKGENFADAGQASSMISSIAANAGVNEKALMESSSVGFRTYGKRGDLGDMKSVKGLSGNARQMAVAQQTISGFNKLGAQEHGSGSARAVENMAAATQLVGGSDQANFHSMLPEINRFGTGEVTNAVSTVATDPTVATAKAKSWENPT